MLDMGWHISEFGLKMVHFIHVLSLSSNVLSLVILNYRRLLQTRVRLLLNLARIQQILLQILFWISDLLIGWSITLTLVLSRLEQAIILFRILLHQVDLLLIILNLMLVQAILLLVDLLTVLLLPIQTVIFLNLLLLWLEYILLILLLWSSTLPFLWKVTSLLNDLLSIIIHNFLLFILNILGYRPNHGLLP